MNTQDSIKNELLDINRELHISPKMADEMGTLSQNDAPITVPPTSLRYLGDPTFCEHYGVQYSYMAGAMANGIASEELVIALAKQGFLAIFGSAGLSLDRVKQAIQKIRQAVGSKPFGVNLIHSPNERDLELALVDFYIANDVQIVEASAFLNITESIVKYRLAGIYRDQDGQVRSTNRIIAKVSRVELAEKFMSPAPEKLVHSLLSKGAISQEQAALAQSLPLSDDVTAEADSGGHTDNRPALTLVPTLVALRDQIQEERQYPTPIRVGAAGGIGTPQSAASAFAMGAAYIVTGTINQACVESGSSDIVRQMLAESGQADVAMAPAADMFEMGVKVQVLKRGTMFPMRAAKLYELYRNHKSLDDLPQADRLQLEKNFFKKSVEDEWQSTRSFFLTRDPKQVERAERDPKHKMALVFRSYLGQASRWANQGIPDRKVDYQVWCGPAMGAFNQWTKGTFLAEAKNRKVCTVALNILYGAAVILRCQSLKLQGVTLPVGAFNWQPRPEAELASFIPKRNLN